MTPAARNEIAIGMKIDELERGLPADALREHREDQADGGGERRRDDHPDRGVAQRPQRRGRRREHALVVVECRRTRTAASYRLRQTVYTIGYTTSTPSSTSAGSRNGHASMCRAGGPAVGVAPGPPSGRAPTRPGAGPGRRCPSVPSRWCRRRSGHRARPSLLFNALVAAASSCWASRRRRSGSTGSPGTASTRPDRPSPPNADGYWSDMSKRTLSELTSASAICRVVLSGYALAGTSLFGEM